MDINLQDINPNDNSEYRIEKARRDLKTSLMCVTNQNIAFQNEKSQKAQQVEDVIDELFDAEKQVMLQNEGYLTAVGEKLLLEQEDQLLNQKSEKLESTVNNDDFEIIKQYLWYELNLFHDIAMFASFLQYSHQQCFDLQSSLLEVVQVPLFPFGSAIMKQRVRKIRNVKKKIETFKTKRPEWHDAGEYIHIKIKNRNLIDKMVTANGVEITIPIYKQDLKENITVVGAYFSLQKNMRLIGTFAYLTFENNTVFEGDQVRPDHLYVRIRQEGNQNFPFEMDDCGPLGQSKTFSQTDTFHAINSFNVEPRQTEPEPTEIPNECWIGSRPDRQQKDFCPSPFSKYHIWLPEPNEINRPNANECPGSPIETQNCIGVSLKGLSEIHFLMKYAYVLDL